MQNQLIFLISVLISAVAVMADMEFTAPKAGKTFTASGGKVYVEIKWDDDGSDLNFKDIEKYIVSLCRGSNNDIECTALEQVTDLTKKSYTASIDGFKFFQMDGTISKCIIHMIWVFLYYIRIRLQIEGYGWRFQDLWKLQCF